MKPRLVAIIGIILAVGIGLNLTLGGDKSVGQFSSPEAMEKALDFRITSFGRAIKGGNAIEVVDVVPPRLIASMAEQSGLSEKKFRKELAKLTQSVLNMGTFHEFSMLRGEIHQSGALSYSLLDTESDITVMGRRNKTQTVTVALLEDGKWYLIRIESPAQAAMLKAAYPELADVKL